MLQISIPLVFSSLSLCKESKKQLSEKCIMNTLDVLYVTKAMLIDFSELYRSFDKIRQIKPV